MLLMSPPTTFKGEEVLDDEDMEIGNDGEEDEEEEEDIEYEYDEGECKQ